MPCASGRWSGENAGGIMMGLMVQLDDAGASGGEGIQLEHSSAGMQGGVVAQTLLRVICMRRSDLCERTKANLLVDWRGQRLRPAPLRLQRAQAFAQWSNGRQSANSLGTTAQSDHPSSLLCHLYIHRTHRPHLFERALIHTYRCSAHTRTQTRLTEVRLCRIFGKAIDPDYLLGFQLGAFEYPLGLLAPAL